MRRLILLVALAALALPTAASATPVATDDSQYAVYGRVFPDPMGGCQQIGTSPCSPNAEGNLPATQFIGIDEFVSGMEYLNSKPQWQRYLEVWPLDGKLGDNEGNVPAGTSEKASFPGNNLGHFEFKPSAAYRSAGLPTTGTGRIHSDLFAVRVTDENVPDAGKKRYAVSLSIHAIERAGAEGGTRAIEDLVTAYTTGLAKKRIVPSGTIASPPTFADVLRRTIIYFVYPNSDGWRRGSVMNGGVFFQRYNGNGVDVNRDWPDVGFSFRPYSSLSEPESQAFAGFFNGVRSTTGAKFADGADLHGQLEADALSYTLLPHGRHDLAKDLRIRTGAEAIHKVSEKALAWSPIIQPNSAPRGGGAPCVPTEVGGDACAKIYGQTWGTVYDTIGYTTTGALGDWFDSPVGLNADGLDNEMSFSHLDKNIVFDPHTEQLHVDGNKALIYAQIATLLNPPVAQMAPRGATGYVPNARLKRAARTYTVAPPAGSVAQATITQGFTPDPSGTYVSEFPVKRGRQPADGSPDAGKNVFNGGLRVDVTKLNFQGISDGNAVTTLKVQCKGCDDHPGVDPDADGWTTVQEDFNQSPLYAQAGLTAAVNRPLTVNHKGQKVLWRAVLDGTPVDAGSQMDVHFFQGPASGSGDTSGAPAPKLRAYDVANTDFFADLNRYSTKRFSALDPAKVGSGAQSLSGLANVVLADNPQAGRSGFFTKLRSWVSGGGNLVLTDGALRALPSLTSIKAGDVKSSKVYVGQVAFEKADGQPTTADPLASKPQTVSQNGARFNSAMRRQTYEPTPLGFAIQDKDGNDAAESPEWDVSRAAWEKAGGRTVATSVEPGAGGAGAVTDRVTVGELRLGKGTIRIIGAVLPQPSERFDHDYGLEPYAVTYTGYIMMCNLLNAGCAAR